MDASCVAYVAVVYFRILYRVVVCCSIVSAKMKVAPRKLLSIPRLELQAAVFGMRLMKTIMFNHTLTIMRKVLWSDSVTVLNWIRSDPRKFRQFVTFRVTEFLEKTEIGHWREVSLRMNVADVATKWSRGPCFQEERRWYKVPKFLYGPECEWPKG